MAITAEATYSPEVLQQPMRRTCARLTGLGADLGSCRALEFFAREGNWHTVSYANKVASLDAWEINPDFEYALNCNLPKARIRIGDSFELSRLPEFAAQFDFIVYDNPQVTFGAENEYCEHFEALDTLTFLMDDKAFVIFNVNRQPFNYESFPEWQKRRCRFYQRANTSHLEDEFLIDFYKTYFRRYGLRIHDLFIEPRHVAYLAYCVAIVQKARA